MDRIAIFLILSVPIIIISRRTLIKFRSHGFYRFCSWECIAWLFACNYKYWFYNPLSIKQIFSWILLVISGYLVIIGLIFLRKGRRHKRDIIDKTLYMIEQTTELIDSGIYKYIRHPLYSSLIFLTWGILLKNIELDLLIIAILSTVFLCITALIEEKECISYFGDKYSEYIKKTKRFIPFLI